MRGKNWVGQVFIGDERVGKGGRHWKRKWEETGRCQYRARTTRAMGDRGNEVRLEILSELAVLGR